MGFVNKIALFLANQMSKDLMSVAAVVWIYVEQAEESHGSGAGEAKKKQVLDRLFEEIAKEGGLNLPGWAVPIAETLLPHLLEIVVGMLYGKKTDILKALTQLF